MAGSFPPEAESPSVRPTLRDGRIVTIRPVRPDDAREMRAAFGRLSEEARYARFMGTVNELSPDMLRRAVHPSANRDCALVAVFGDGPDAIIVGGARYMGAGDGESCEFAVTITDGWRALGLASRLMEELIRAARARGLKRMEGMVLATNHSMLGLARRLGFRLTSSEEGPAVRMARLDLRGRE